MVPNQKEKSPDDSCHLCGGKTERRFKDGQWRDGCCEVCNTYSMTVDEAIEARRKKDNE